MICAYCGSDSKKTREHIISKSVLDLFPECDLTFSSNKDKPFFAEPVIKDVCANCNNNLINYIDSYAKKIIKTYFLKTYEKDDEVSIEYNYTLLVKVLLKYAFNDMRSKKIDTSYFDNNIKEFLMNKNNNTITKPISILGGLNINTSFCPSFLFDNMKLRWIYNPILLDNSLIRFYDENTGQIYLREELKRWIDDKLILSYIFKFNSGQFILLCWDSEESKIFYDRLLTIQYPYTLLSENNKNVFKRCTHAYNWDNIWLVDVIWGMGLADMTNSCIDQRIDPIEMQKILNQDWEKHENEIREKKKNSKKG